jgi:uncharacterized phage-associated protein
MNSSIYKIKTKLVLVEIKSILYYNILKRIEIGGFAMIQFLFDIKKNIEIVSFLIDKNQGKINYAKLIKLLYIADKKFLEKWDTTITGDYYCSMENGPVLSKLYDLILNKDNSDNQEKWNKHINLIDRYYLTSIMKETAINKLSLAEVEVLKEVYEKFKNYNEFDMFKYTHNPKLFPEVKWKEVEKNKTSISLYIEDILRALKRTDEQIEIIQKENELILNEQNKFHECGLI